jgi:hypothetical protein
MLKKLQMWRLLIGSPFAYEFGRISKTELYQRLDQAAELAGRGPGYFSSRLA